MFQLILIWLLIPLHFVAPYQIKCNHGHKAYTLSCRFSYIADNTTLASELPADFAEYCEYVTQVTLGISNLTALPSDLFTVLPNLHTLTARADIRSITGEQFANASHLAALDLGFNNQVDRLEANLFRFTPLLEYVDLGFNQIVDIEFMAFDGLTRLRKLYLEANLLTELDNETFYGADNLMMLELSTNQLRALGDETFGRMGRLKILKLNRNQISRLQSAVFTGLKSVERIDLSVNQISDIEPGAFDNLSSLAVLELGFNRITTIPPLAGVPHLLALFLAYNQLADIGDAFADLSQLRLLDVSYNAITLNDSSAFVALHNLDSLELRGCNLTEIAADLFGHLPNLTVLDLSDNQLGTVNLSLFSGLTKLRTLKLEANQISELDDYGDLKVWMPSLEYVSIARNEIDCDTITEIIAYLTNHSVSYELGEEVDVGCRLLPFRSRAIQAYRLSKAELYERPVTGGEAAHQATDDEEADENDGDESDTESDGDAENGTEVTVEIVRLQENGSTESSVQVTTARADDSAKVFAELAESGGHEGVESATAFVKLIDTTMNPIATTSGESLKTHATSSSETSFATEKASFNGTTDTFAESENSLPNRTTETSTKKSESDRGNDTTETSSIEAVERPTIEVVKSSVIQVVKSVSVRKSTRTTAEPIKSPTKTPSEIIKAGRAIDTTEAHNVLSRANTGTSSNPVKTQATETTTKIAQPLANNVPTAAADIMVVQANYGAYTTTETTVEATENYVTEATTTKPPLARANDSTKTTEKVIVVQASYGATNIVDSRSIDSALAAAKKAFPNVFLCWECDSLTNEDCNDPFNNATISPVDCATMADHQQCRKIIHPDGRIIRGCLIDDQSSQQLREASIYLCNENGCNFASSHVPATALFAALPLILAARNLF